MELPLTRLGSWSMTIAFLFARTPEQRDVTRFSIPELAAQQNVLLLDLSAALGRYPVAEIPIVLPPTGHLHTVHSLDQFEEIVTDSSVKVIIDLLPSGRIRNTVLAVCNAARIPSIRHAVGPIPPLPKPSFPNLVFQQSSRLTRNWTELLDSCVAKLKPSSEAPFHTFIGTGDKSLRSSVASRASRIISGRSLDCDENERVLELQGLPPRFSVFVDSGGPLHPDLQLLGIKSSTSEENYFTELRRFLNTAQDRLSMPVLVARHPRMAFFPYAEKLPGFRIFDSATPELVRRSKIVFDSGSTATSFSVLNRKPIRYIIPGASKGDYLWRLASAFGTAMGLEVHNDCDSFAQSLLDTREVSTERYAEYRRNYLFSDDHTERSFSQEILNFISEL